MISSTKSPVFQRAFHGTYDDMHQLQLQAMKPEFRLLLCMWVMSFMQSLSNWLNDPNGPSIQIRHYVTFFTCTVSPASSTWNRSLQSGLLPRWQRKWIPISAHSQQSSIHRTRATHRFGAKQPLQYLQADSFGQRAVGWPPFQRFDSRMMMKSVRLQRSSKLVWRGPAVERRHKKSIDIVFVLLVGNTRDSYQNWHIDLVHSA